MCNRAIGTERPGDVNRIVQAWKDATKEKPAGPKPQTPPKLPAGTKIDLAYQELKIDDVSYDIPKSVGTPGTPAAARSATQLTDLEWLTIARNNRLTYGIDLEGALSRHEG